MYGGLPQIDLCSPASDRNQPHFIWNPAALPLMPYHFLTFLKPATAQLLAAFKEKRAIGFLSPRGMDTVSQSCHWSWVKEAGEWPAWQWHCVIVDRGHGVRGERGRHYKETDAWPRASCSVLPYRSNVQHCLCLHWGKGQKSTQTEVRVTFLKIFGKWVRY